MSLTVFVRLCYCKVQDVKKMVYITYCLTKINNNKFTTLPTNNLKYRKAEWMEYIWSTLITCAIISFCLSESFQMVIPAYAHYTYDSILLWFLQNSLWSEDNFKKTPHVYIIQHFVVSICWTLDNHEESFQ